MSRFGNLEFESHEQPRYGAESESRDGAYWMASAQTAYQSMDFELALRHYSRVLEFDPGSIQAWSWGSIARPGSGPTRPSSASPPHRNCWPRRRWP